MPPKEIIINLLLSSFSIVLTGIVGWVVYGIRARNEKRDQQEELRQKALEEREEKQRAEYAALKLGVQAILRDRIIQAEIKATTDGGITAEEKSNVELMYKAYHGLGGNGVASAAYHHVIDLPLTGDGHA